MNYTVENELKVTVKHNKQYRLEPGRTETGG